MSSTGDRNPFNEPSDEVIDSDDRTDVNLVLPRDPAADADDDPATIQRLVITSRSSMADGDDIDDGPTLKRPPPVVAPPPPPPMPLPASMLTPVVAAAPPAPAAPTVSNPSMSRPTTREIERPGPPPRGRTGFVVHRASEAAAAAAPSVMAAPPPPVKAAVQEALEGLKRSSLTSGSVPAVKEPSAAVPRASSMSTGSMATVKPEVMEALAGLKLASSSSLVSGSMPVPRPSPSTTSADGIAVVSPPKGPPVGIAPDVLRRAALAVGVVFAVTTFIVVAPRSAIMEVPPVQDLPVVQMPATALPCVRMQSRRRVLDCVMPRSIFFAMPPQDRTPRLSTMRALAKAGGFEKVRLVDEGGLWREESTEPDSTPKPKPLPVVATVPLPALEPAPLPKVEVLPPSSSSKPTKVSAP